MQKYNSGEHPQRDIPFQHLRGRKARIVSSENEEANKQSLKQNAIAVVLVCLFVPSRKRSLPWRTEESSDLQNAKNHGKS